MRAWSGKSNNNDDNNGDNDNHDYSATKIHALQEQYQIHHATIQVEKSLEFCDDACAGW